MKHLTRALPLVCLTLALGGCQTTSAPMAMSPFEQALAACVQTSNDDRVQSACLQRRGQAGGFSAGEMELVAFSVLTQERRAQGKITKAEADYLMVQQINRLHQQDAAAEAQRAKVAQQQRAEIGERLANLSRAFNARDAQVRQTTTTDCNTFIPGHITCTSN